MSCFRDFFKQPKILNKIHLSGIVYRNCMTSFSLIYSRHLIILGLGYCKNKKLTSFFYCVITLSKFIAEPLACDSWFHSHFKVPLKRNLSSIRGQTHKNCQLKTLKIMKRVKTSLFGSFRPRLHYARGI